MLLRVEREAESVETIERTERKRRLVTLFCPSSTFENPAQSHFFQLTNKAAD